jgi:hypothetical protein
MMILVTISAREVVIQIRATRKTMPTKHRKIKVETRCVGTTRMSPS